MKRIAFILITLLIVSCASENKNDALVRELAKKDIIEKLDLPEGTSFNNENIEVTETEAKEGSLGLIYIVKITIKSQDRAGNAVTKTHVMNYKKTDDSGSTSKDYELISFE
ncbi:hypothetical protein [Aequorivita marina]|uniref:hypothetical protein n=1 Tax=Aequorivita marina TaxID=3073654 RepID=UPI002876F869|nr:hypothetical protein [Aequorivita sp. S2608]MDS1297933.1 hypothetical protein [Aequorivita sp. S2608]